MIVQSTLRQHGSLVLTSASEFLLVFNVQLGSTAIGIQTPGGVVLAVEKRVTSPLIVPTSIEKIMEIDVHIGMPGSIISVFDFCLAYFILYKNCISDSNVMHF